jgi:hypothetical protein
MARVFEPLMILAPGVAIFEVLDEPFRSRHHRSADVRVETSSRLAAARDRRLASQSQIGPRTEVIAMKRSLLVVLPAVVGGLVCAGYGFYLYTE